MPRFQPEGGDPFSRKVVGVKVLIGVEALIDKLPDSIRSKWIRQVISDAAIKDLALQEDFEKTVQRLSD